jgi:hypothetical protein
MSDVSVLPYETPEKAAAADSPAPLPAVALVSFATLLLELALTRLFSVVLFYHFAFLAISVALLGLGAGGVFSYLRRARLARVPTRRLGAWLCGLNAVATVAVLEIVLHVPVSLGLDRANFLRLTALYLAAAVPFFFTGLLFSTLFARESGRISHLYGADLAGGALACLAVVPLLDWLGGPNAILSAALAMAVAAAAWAERGGRRKAALTLAALLGLLIAANHSGGLIDIVYAKGMRRDRPWMLFARWNAISRVEVDQQGDSKVIVIDADASTAIMNVDPHRWQGTVWERDLMAQAPAVVNVLRPKGDYAIIGPGGGVDVLRAVANGSPNVAAIEINPIIASTIMRGRYADYAFHLYEIPEVHLHVGDGRSWIRQSHEQYDVIQMTLVDTWASTAAGAFSLSENNLYTTEAFREYFDHLKPDGIIAITRWEFKEPREALRVVAQEIEVLRQMGVSDVRGHFIIIADGELSEDGRPVTVLVKKTPFTPAEETSVLLHAWATKNLYPVYTPSIYTTGPTAMLDGLICPGFHAPTVCKFERVRDLRQRRAAAPQAVRPFDLLINAPARTDFADLHWNPRNEFVAQYPYNIAPVTDDAPFFFFTLRTGQVLKGILAGTGRGMDWRINLGTVVLGMLLVISLVAVGAFLVLPLALYAPARAAGGARLLYFVAVGLGYILVEIAFIQRFVLFLGHPTYALTVVIFLLLLASGAGSVLARRWLGDPLRVRLPLALIVLALVAYVFLLPRLLGGLVGLAFVLKLGLSAAVLAPLGLAMGMPFPSGLRALAASVGEGGENTIEWAWAMNAAASVLGSVLAMVIAIHYGLAVTLACGAGAYVVATLLVGTLRSLAPPTGH